MTVTIQTLEPLDVSVRNNGTVDVAALMGTLDADVAATVADAIAAAAAAADSADDAADSATTAGTASVSASASAVSAAASAALAETIVGIPSEDAAVAYLLEHDTDTRAALLAMFPRVTVIVGAGIDPSGATDSAAGIQAILDTVEDGDWVHWPAGIYRIDDTLIMPDKIGWSIHGSGIASPNTTGGTVIVPAEDTPAFQFHADTVALPGVGQYGIEITDLSIMWADPSGTGNTEQIAFLYRDTVNSNSTWFRHTYRRVTIHNAYDCWTTNGSAGNPSVWDMHWENTQVYGIQHSVWRFMGTVGQPVCTWRDVGVTNTNTDVEATGRVFDLAGFEGHGSSIDIEGWRNGIFTNAGGLGVTFDGVHIEWHTIDNVAAAEGWKLFTTGGSMLTLRNVSLGGESAGGPFGYTVFASAANAGDVITVDQFTNAMVLTAPGEFDLFFGGEGSYVLGSYRDMPGATAVNMPGPAADRTTRLAGVLKPKAYATGGRPSAAVVGKGAMVFDTTLNKPIWSDGASWVDATGTGV